MRLTRSWRDVAFGRAGLFGDLAAGVPAVVVAGALSSLYVSGATKSLSAGGFVGHIILSTALGFLMVLGFRLVEYYRPGPVSLTVSVSIVLLLIDTAPLLREAMGALVFVALFTAGVVGQLLRVWFMLKILRNPSYGSKRLGFITGQAVGCAAMVVGLLSVGPIGVLLDDINVMTWAFGSEYVAAEAKSSNRGGLFLAVASGGVKPEAPLSSAPLAGGVSGMIFAWRRRRWPTREGSGEAVGDANSDEQGTMSLQMKYPAPVETPGREPKTPVVDSQLLAQSRLAARVTSILQSEHIAIAELASNIRLALSVLDRVTVEELYRGACRVRERAFPDWLSAPSFHQLIGDDIAYRDVPHVQSHRETSGGLSPHLAGGGGRLSPDGFPYSLAVQQEAGCRSPTLWDSLEAMGVVTYRTLRRDPSRGGYVLSRVSIATLMVLSLWAPRWFESSRCRELYNVQYKASEYIRWNPMMMPDFAPWDYGCAGQISNPPLNDPSVVKWLIWWFGT